MHKVGVYKVKESTGKGYPHRDQGEGPGAKMPKQVRTKRANASKKAGTTKGSPMRRPGWTERV